MRNWLLLTALCALPLTMQAQDDDMYFASKKSAKKSKAEYISPSNTYYSGSTRNVDEYNRRVGYRMNPIANDSTGNDIINFSAVEGVYPDSVAGDFQLTREMSRWDGYTPTDAYWEGYDRGRSDEWRNSWHSPWYYSSYYPWYDSYWYDPWYYSSWHYGWYDPWYRPYYHYGWGWGGYYSSWYYRPYHYVSVRNSNRVGAGTINRYGRTHGAVPGGRSYGTASGNVRNRTNASLRNSNSAASSRTGINSGNVRNRSIISNSSSASSSRSTGSYSSSSSRSSSSSMGSFGGSSSRSSGSSMGGSSSRGGSFGGGGGGSSRRR